ncbi:ABC transporter permease [Ferrimonas pelagia]|uniref:ABC transporter permease n=1 Tax=Ferrimonas pelagia TaxID=1177826 RepID=A0ABP9EBR3_9GAMM
MFKQIWLKESKDIWRDKKTLWFIVLFPTLVIPALLGGVIYFSVVSMQGKFDEVLRFQVHAPPAWQSVIHEQLAGHDKLVGVESKTDGSAERIRQAVNQGSVDFVLVIPEDFEPTRAKVSDWQLYYNQADDLGQFDRIDEVLQPLFERWQDDHRQRWHLSQVQADVLTKPVRLDWVGTADKREDLGEKIGGMLPYILLLLCLMGAMMPALDIGAGEKERGTLETLLLTPVARSTIVFAKFTVIATSSLLVAFLTIASGLGWSLLLGQFFALEALVEVVSAIGLLDLTLILAMLVPISLFYAAMLLAVSIYARTYKEGQNYMAPFNFLAILPAMVAMIPGLEFSGWVPWAPIVNVTLATKELLKGTMVYWDLLPVFMTNFALALALLLFCTYWFRREQVLFR